MSERNKSTNPTTNPIKKEEKEVKVTKIRSGVTGDELQLLADRLGVKPDKLKELMDGEQQDRIKAEQAIADRTPEEVTEEDVQDLEEIQTELDEVLNTEELNMDNISDIAASMREVLDKKAASNNPFDGKEPCIIIPCKGVVVYNPITKQNEVHHVGDDFYVRTTRKKTMKWKDREGIEHHDACLEFRECFEQDAAATDVNGEPLVKRCQPCQQWHKRVSKRKTGPNTLAELRKKVARGLSVHERIEQYRESGVWARIERSGQHMKMLKVVNEGLEAAKKIRELELKKEMQAKYKRDVE